MNREIEVSGVKVTLVPSYHSHLSGQYCAVLWWKGRDNRERAYSTTLAYCPKSWDIGEIQDIPKLHWVVDHIERVKKARKLDAFIIKQEYTVECPSCGWVFRMGLRTQLQAEEAALIHLQEGCKCEEN